MNFDKYVHLWMFKLYGIFPLAQKIPLHPCQPTGSLQLMELFSVMISIIILWIIHTFHVAVLHSFLLLFFIHSLLEVHLVFPGFGSPAILHLIIYRSNMFLLKTSLFISHLSYQPKLKSNSCPFRGDYGAATTHIFCWMECKLL